MHDILLGRQIRRAGDLHTNGLLANGRDIAGAPDHAGRPRGKEVEHERRHRPADIDLTRHHLGDGARDVSGRDGFGLEAIFADEPQHRDMGGCAGGGICNALTVDLAHRLQRRLGGDPPKRFSRPGGARADDAKRCSLRIRPQAAEHTRAQADIDRARHDDLQGLAAALGVEDVEIEICEIGRPACRAPGLHLPSCRGWATQS